MKSLVFSIILFVIVIDCIAQNNKALNKKTESLYNEAKISAQAGDRVKAIALLNQVLKYDPKYFMAFFGLADIYHETGE
ncbi:MAG: tetratricopeptide repeat protein, partial [Bacteroidia bacterium]|nr:tetratricopeptide repeat protein [Bacteroidia bacterium]